MLRSIRYEFHFLIIPNLHQSRKRNEWIGKLNYGWKYQRISRDIGPTLASWILSRERITKYKHSTADEDREEATKKKLLPHIFSAIVSLLTFFIVRFEMRCLLLPILLSISHFFYLRYLRSIQTIISCGFCRIHELRLNVDYCQRPAIMTLADIISFLVKWLHVPTYTAFRGILFFSERLGSY